MNEAVKTAIRVTGIKRATLADIVGVSEPTLYRWLRHELTSDKRERLLKAITEWHAKELTDEQHS